MLGVFLNLYYYYYSLFSSLVLKDPKLTKDFIRFSISEDQRLCFSWLEQDILKMESTIQNLDIVYPYKILSEFVKKATKHYENDAQKELMACVIGYRKGNKLIGEELLFPEQSCPHTNNTDLGKEYLGKLYIILY